MVEVLRHRWVAADKARIRGEKVASAYKYIPHVKYQTALSHYIHIHDQATGKKRVKENHMPFRTADPQAAEQNDPQNERKIDASTLYAENCKMQNTKAKGKGKEKNKEKQLKSPP